jgi:hypothetical protein
MGCDFSEEIEEEEEEEDEEAPPAAAAAVASPVSISLAFYSTTNS